MGEHVCAYSAYFLIIRIQMQRTRSQVCNLCGITVNKTGPAALRDHQRTQACRDVAKSAQEAVLQQSSPPSKRPCVSTPLVDAPMPICDESAVSGAPTPITLPPGNSGCGSAKVVAVPSIGLINSGNTCFANSVLQVLMHTVPLVQYIRKHDEHTCKAGLDVFIRTCGAQVSA